MEYFRGSKFAQVLGFGVYRGVGDGSPVNMAPLDLFPVEDDQPDSSFQQAPLNLPFGTSPAPTLVLTTSRNNINANATPVEPSFYQEQGGSRMVDTQWTMNYQEAAIYLEEGDNNEQFSAHPKRKESLPAYFLAHTSWFYVLDLLASLVLILLAVIEKPAVEAFKVSHRCWKPIFVFFIINTIKI